MCWTPSLSRLVYSHTTLEPRRASVAIIIRVVPSPAAPTPAPGTTQPTLTEFFELDWVNDPKARPEILFLQRETSVPYEASSSSPPRIRNTHEAHVAFPGGRTEPDDEGGMYTGEKTPLFFGRRRF